MQGIDYFASQNKGLENIVNAFSSNEKEDRLRRAEERQIKTDDLHREIATQQLETGRVALDETKKNREALAEVYKALSKTTKPAETITPISSPMGTFDESVNQPVITPERPFTNTERARAAMTAAVSSGRPEAMKAAGEAPNLLEKMNPNQATTLMEVMKQAAIVAFMKGPEAGQKALEDLAAEHGISKEQVGTGTWDANGVWQKKTAEGGILWVDPFKMTVHHEKAVAPPHASTSISVTEKGNFPIWKDPTTQQTLVVKPDGTREIYNPTIHGREIATNATEKTPTAYSQFASGFKAEYLKTHPNATPEEIDSATYKEADRRGINKAVSVVVEKEKIADATGFKSWTPEAKQQTFMYNAITKEPPVNAKGLGGTDRKAYGKEYAQWQVDSGLKPQDIAAMQADFKAGSMSLNNMKKQEAPMRAFVNNINSQVDYAKQLFDGLQRTDVRLLNVPLRELKTRIIGSGLERQYELFLQEISMEANKLAQGSSASIAQIPEGNRKEWLRIHDINLPLKEIMPVLEGTKTMANMRMSTWVEAKDIVRNELRMIGAEETPDPSSTPLPTKNKKGWILQQDAKGNKAYVGPNKEIEEVK